MNAFRRTSVRMWTARAVALAMLPPVLVSPGGAVAAQGRPLPPTVMVLTFAPSPESEAAVPAALGASLTRAMTSSLRGTGKFEVVQFSTSSPSIVRAVEEGRLRVADITPPFDDPEVAVRLGREVGTDYVLAGLIEDYRYDGVAYRASMSVSVQWIEVKSGRTLKTVAISAEATGTATSTQDELNAKAVSEAVNRVLQELAIGEVSVVQPSAAPMKKPAVKRGSSVGWIVLGLGLIAAFATGSRSSGAGTEPPPPSPY